MTPLVDLHDGEALRPTLALIAVLDDLRAAGRAALDAPTKANWVRLSQVQRAVGEVYGDLASAFLAASGLSALAAEGVPA